MNIKALKRTHLHLGGLLSLLALLAALFFLGVDPVLSARKQLQSMELESVRLAALESQLGEDRAELVEKLVGLQAEVDHKTEQVDQAKPLLSHLSTMLRKRRIDLQNFLERDYDKNSVRVELQLRGAYRDVVLLIDDITRSDRPTRIVSFQMSSSQADGKECQVQLYLRFPATNA